MAKRKSSTIIAQRTVGAYRCTVHIATGGFGTVWKAVGKDRENVVAIKLMNPDKAESREMRGIFEREYKICSKFDHPGLLHYLEYGEFESIPYMVMDFFPGINLKSAITGEKASLVRANFKPIVKNIAAALQYIHEHGVVHRDMKPENVLLGEGSATKLIDFSNALSGLGKWISFRRKRSGSPSYMAPEQIENKKILPAADIYSFGTTLFEMLAGRPPFVGDSDNAILQQHMSAKAPPLSRFNQDVSSAMEKLIADMLEKKPEMRVPDMHAFQSRFSRIEVYKN